jgi:hypothetical protein
MPAFDGMTFQEECDLGGQSFDFGDLLGHEIVYRVEFMRFEEHSLEMATTQQQCLGFKQGTEVVVAAHQDALRCVKSSRCAGTPTKKAFAARRDRLDHSPDNRVKPHLLERAPLCSLIPSHGVRFSQCLRFHLDDALMQGAEVLSVAVKFRFNLSCQPGVIVAEPE